MTVPSFNVTQLDGNLGRTLDTSKVLAMAGIASAGDEAVPKMMTRVEQVIAEYESGPLVDYACFAIQAYGIPVLCGRVKLTAYGTCSAVTKVGSGTSVVTVGASPHPNNDWQPALKIITGGTIATAGIEYQTSLDGGRTWSATQALGTSVSVSLAGAGTLGFSLGSGTMIAGDLFSFYAASPTWIPADLTACITALGQHSAQWEGLSVVGNLLVEDFDATELVKTSMFNRGRDILWMGGYRLPTSGESEATYLAAAIAEFTSRSTYGGVCYGGVRVSSAIDGGKYIRSPLILAAPLLVSVSTEIDIAMIDLGPLSTATITDENNNPELHDELLNPGADDAGFLTLRTWPGEDGVYINNPRIYSASGSDYEFMQHRRVVNKALQSVRAFFRRRLSKAIRVKRSNGYIIEPDAREMEKGANTRLTNALMKKPEVSYVQCTVARDDNLLSTKTLTVNLAIVPLAYPKTINLSIGLYNPALVTLPS